MIGLAVFKDGDLVVTRIVVKKINKICVDIVILYTGSPAK